MTEFENSAYMLTVFFDKVHQHATAAYDYGRGVVHVDTLAQLCEDYAAYRRYPSVTEE